MSVEELKERLRLYDELYDRLRNKPVDWEDVKAFLSAHPQADRTSTLKGTSPPLSFVKWLVEEDKLPIRKFTNGYGVDVWGDKSAEFPDILKYLLDKANLKERKWFVPTAASFDQIKTFRYMMEEYGLNTMEVLEDVGLGFKCLVYLAIHHDPVLIQSVSPVRQVKPCCVPTQLSSSSLHTMFSFSYLFHIYRPMPRQDSSMTSGPLTGSRAASPSSGPRRLRHWCALT